ncbi:hypothetical protein M9Y10_004735 [Tritrichomonas musculus]|uniref:Uncharacterized protein n=1 Tax=Tritrichomonas musculus TaxID=1915356 RepID=A0ABR2JL91_9EUKA
MPKPIQPVEYPSVVPIPQTSNQSTNFTIPQMTGAYPSQQPINNISQDRGISDLVNEIDELETRSKFLKILL